MNIWTEICKVTQKRASGFSLECIIYFQLGSDHELGHYGAATQANDLIFGNWSALRCEVPVSKMLWVWEMGSVQNVDPPSGPPFWTPYGPRLDPYLDPHLDPNLDPHLDPYLDPFWTPIWIPIWTPIWTLIWTPSFSSRKWPNDSFEVGKNIKKLIIMLKKTKTTRWLE